MASSKKSFDYTNLYISQKIVLATLHRKENYKYSVI